MRKGRQIVDGGVRESGTTLLAAGSLRLAESLGALSVQSGAVEAGFAADAAGDVLGSDGADVALAAARAVRRSAAGDALVVQADLSLRRAIVAGVALLAAGGIGIARHALISETAGRAILRGAEGRSLTEADARFACPAGCARPAAGAAGRGRLPDLADIALATTGTGPSAARLLPAAGSAAAGSRNTLDRVGRRTATLTELSPKTAGVVDGAVAAVVRIETAPAAIGRSAARLGSRARALEARALGATVDAGDAVESARRRAQLVVVKTLVVLTAPAAVASSTESLRGVASAEITRRVAEVGYGEIDAQRKIARVIEGEILRRRGGGSVGL